MLHLSWKDIHERAKTFVTNHSGDKSEAAQKQTFWNEFFDVFGLRRASFASFEENARNVKGNRSFIDLLWKGKLLVEHKSRGKDLDDASLQAFDYIGDLTKENRWDEVPRFVLVSDFARFALYDLEPDGQAELPLFAGTRPEPLRFTLAEFPAHLRAFDFMLGRKGKRTRPEDPANDKAYALMCKLHDELRAGGFAGHDLERLLVRVLFCLFAEDTYLFAPDVFTQFIREQTRDDGSDVGSRLNELFYRLNRPEVEAITNDLDPFYGFRYVNGGLFHDPLGFPQFNRAMRDTLLKCCEFQWAASPHIVHGNALRLEWNDVLPCEQCSYVLGNPPFVGKHYQNTEQRADMVRVFGDFANTGDLDYVTTWFIKAGAYVQGTHVRIGFVATNSITQGEQVPVLWGILFQRFHLKIHFAHRTFSWTSEAKGKAHVHVVIIGFGTFDLPVKFITDYDVDPKAPTVVESTNISPYLTPGSDSFVTKQRQPLSNVPEMRCGNKPTDDGNLILTDAERVEFLQLEPDAEKFLRPFTGSEEFINGNMRWCLWLKDAAPGEVRKLPKVVERVERVREFRAKSTAKPTQRAAATPSLFFYISQPGGQFIAIPEVSSERRKYIPIGFLPPDIIVSNKIFVLPSSDKYLFGVLSSALHMTWVGTVGGRMKSDYSYSGSMVYNNFPWPNPTPAQKLRVEEKAQAVLAAREPFLPPRGMNTLADLYDPLTMPAALAKAHAELDRAVERCYRPEPFLSDRERVEHLFRLYEQLTAPLLPATPAVGSRRRGNRRPANPAPGRRGRTPGLPDQS